MIRHIISFTTRFLPRHRLQQFAGVAMRLVAVFFRGNRFEDPISGKTYRKLLPYGRVNLRNNALAPHSMSLERHRLLWLYLKEKTNFFSAPLKVLHIAPEYCFLKPFGMLRNIEYVTADLNSPWAKVKLDVQNIPFPENEFDIILCNHVLEHVADDRLAMREFFRVLKPNGFGIFQVPLDSSMEETQEDKSVKSPEMREKLYGQRDHVRLYGNDYGKRLAEAGFRVTEDDFAKRMPPELAERYALPKDEVIYFCQK
ncbi:MAG TPA: methyltransferase domain-containing protein [Tenuifilaceae bacterium]|nr:methyltransferase domain-containing protein [Tenuifilaceae bacterium]